MSEYRKPPKPPWAEDGWEKLSRWEQALAEVRYVSERDAYEAEDDEANRKAEAWAMRTIPGYLGLRREFLGRTYEICLRRVDD